MEWEKIENESIWDSIKKTYMYKLLFTDAITLSLTLEDWKIKLWVTIDDVSQNNPTDNKRTTMSPAKIKAFLDKNLLSIRNFFS